MRTKAVSPRAILREMLLVNEAMAKVLPPRGRWEVGHGEQITGWVLNFLDRVSGKGFDGR